MTILRRPIVVLDTETTGFPEQPWSRVVEVAAVALDVNGNETAHLSELVRPEIHDHRAAGAERIHGLTREVLAGADLAGNVAARLAGFMDGLACTSFNLAFDRPMLERMGVERANVMWAPCIMLKAMEVMGPAGVLLPANKSHPRYVPGRDWLWPSLVDTAGFFGVQRIGDPHRALSDARLAAGVLVEIAKRSAA